MEINQYYSYQHGELPKGCQYCVRGEKLVLFVTGICPRSCHFCPVSDEKYQKDVQFANERKMTELNTVEELMKEAEMMQAKGAGITGGDPLARLDRTCSYIKKLKERFGKSFHIHLYTSLNLVTLETLQRLYDAGLDEIRFHLDLDHKVFWDRLSLAKKWSWDVGVEVPLVVGKEEELKTMVDFVAGKDDYIQKADFLNVNELELADNQHYSQEGKAKNETSYAVEGSEKLGLGIMDHVQKNNYPLDVHLCTAKLKDGIQLTERIKRESVMMRKKFDQVDEEGMLIRGALYLPELMPGFGYREKLKALTAVNKDDILKRLQVFYDRIKKKFKLDGEEIYLDLEKCRILISRRLCKKKAAYFLDIGLTPAAVIEYPTADQLEIEVEFLI